MNQLGDLCDTIVALATAPGVSAIGVVRLSGSDAITIANKIFKGKDLVNQHSHTIHFGHVVSLGETIDEVVVSLFLGTKSYTGENTVEISGHGSPFILGKIIDAAVAAGARLAKPGEFTQRAFLNGKLDLTQAEAVADLIASENAASHKVALNQLRGGISSELQDMRKHLIKLIALMELELDFAEEDVEFANRNELNDLLERLMARTEKMIISFDYGNAIKEGVPVAIAGKPNAGKSTLLNTLLQEERAIVSPIAGTTRDTIEESLTINGIKFRFIDTAGLRDTIDEIEAIGVERARKKISQARVLLYLYDHTDKAEDIINHIQSLHHSSLTTILVRNKIDLEGGYFESDLDKKLKESLFGKYTNSIVAISAKDEASVQTLKNHLAFDFINIQNDNSVIITNRRHVAALKDAFKELQQTQTLMQQGLSNDLLSFHLRLVSKHLGSITGEIDIDKDILGAIFSEFCIGK